MAVRQKQFDRDNDMTLKKQNALMVLAAIFILYAGLLMQVVEAYGHTGSGDTTLETLRLTGSWLRENRPQLMLLIPLILIAPGIASLAVFALLEDRKKPYPLQSFETNDPFFVGNTVRSHFKLGRKNNPFKSSPYYEEYESHWARLIANSTEARANQ